MSSAVALRQSACASQTLSLFDHAGGEPTLDQLVSGVWQGLTARASGSCVICGGQMVAHYGAHARPVLGRCTSCGSTLS
jgi:hypothetical protein